MVLPIGHFKLHYLQLDFQSIVDITNDVNLVKFDRKNTSSENIKYTWDSLLETHRFETSGGKKFCYFARTDGQVISLLMKKGDDEEGNDDIYGESDDENDDNEVKKNKPSFREIQGDFRNNAFERIGGIDWGARSLYAAYRVSRNYPGQNQNT